MRPIPTFRLRATGPATWTLALALTACGTLVGNPEEDDSDKGTPKNDTPSAPVTFSLTDAPVDGAQSVMIRVSGLEVSSDGEGWTDIPLAQTTAIDLLKYQEGAALTLGEADALPVGTYEHTRLTLDETNAPTITLVDGSLHDLEIPSGSETGLKINTAFTVEEGKPLALTIDFDLRKSLNRTGGGNDASPRYKLKPVLRLVVDAESGTISGESEAAVVCAFASGVTPDANSDCPNSTNSSTVKQGRFKLAFLPAGTYTVRAFDASGGFEDLAGAVVEAGKTAVVEGL